MKKLIPIALSFLTAAALTMGSSLVSAQDASATASSTTTGSSSASGKDFQDRKARILQHINDRITKMQQILSCVQAAEDIKALRACKPHNGKEDHDKGQVVKTH
jgi:hypothetical protein